MPMAATPKHLEELSLSRRKPALQPGGHGQQVLDRHDPPGGVQVWRVPAGEELDYGLLDVVDVTLVDGDANQR